MTMIFIPGMKPGHVAGAAGSSRRSRGGTLTFGGAYRGKATPKDLVPFEFPKSRTAEENAKKEARKRDVADALHFVRDAPTSAKEKLRETYARANEVEF